MKFFKKKKNVIESGIGIDQTQRIRRRNWNWNHKFLSQLITKNGKY